MFYETVLRIKDAEKPMRATVMAFLAATGNARGTHPATMRRIMVHDYKHLKVLSFLELVALVNMSKPAPAAAVSTHRRARPVCYQTIQVDYEKLELIYICLPNKRSAPGRMRTTLVLHFQDAPAVSISGSDGISIARRMQAAMGEPTRPAWNDRQ